MEIGSEFVQDSNVVGSNQYFDLMQGEKRFALSGRTALNHVAEDIKSKRKFSVIALPSYCCKTMIEPFLIAGTEIVFYDNYDSCSGADAVLIMDYFGFLSDSTYKFAEKCKDSGKVIIVDATQTAFSKSRVYNLADYLVVSYRKWTDCLCAVVYSKDGFSIAECLDTTSGFTDMWRKFAVKKRNYLQNCVGNKSEFLQGFSNANSELSNHWINCVADSTEIKKVKTIDSENLRCKRRKNAEVLIEGIENIPEIELLYKELKSEDCPLFIPIMTRKREELRKKLILHSVYCPVHWPLSELHQKISSSEMYERELSLICDQRYTVDDMKRILKIICE